ncbi:hypothetical protein SPHINGOT1_200106 [Sphingomonas sp. T1]|nr:hypothetical protein SPHINGOT1_200106 [Sphingomonas sp. T1]
MLWRASRSLSSAAGPLPCPATTFMTDYWTPKTVSAELKECLRLGSGGGARMADYATNSRVIDLSQRDPFSRSNQGRLRRTFANRFRPNHHARV